MGRRAGHRSAGGRYLWISLLVVVLDQLSKYLVITEIPYGTSGIGVLPFFSLVHVYNTGAAFSFLAGMGGWQRWLFIGIALVISVVLTLMLLRTSKTQRMLCLGLSLVIGGAIGNLIDRALFGHVVDFLLFYIRGSDFYWAYPAFNVADIGVCVGAFIMVWCGLFVKSEY